LPRVFHDIEKKIIRELRDSTESTPERLEQKTGLSADQVRRGVEWLRLKNLAVVDETVGTAVSLGKNGLDALEKGLPERRLLELVRDGPQKISVLQERLRSLFGPAVGLAKRNGWIRVSGDEVSIRSYPDRLPEEPVIASIGREKIPPEKIPDQRSYGLLKRRPDFVVESAVKSKTVRLADHAKNIEVEPLQRVRARLDSAYDMAGAIDVEAGVPPSFAARRHPLKETIDEIREIFVALGFAEIAGSLSQPSFWNFDALFTPQDHPAREMQDTFYLDKVSAKRIGTRQQIGNVAASHRRGWRYLWDVREARKMVLRTHTTCVTIRHLAESKPDEARVFSLGRVFRNEKVSYKHLVEFNQVEGVVVGKDATLRDLMGIQREFYKRIGIARIKFWPTFFPYTEPSLQTMVYNEGLGRWVELFGMGIFRPEVTKPLGIAKPVLAWGGGIERIAMLKYGLGDVREFYNNDLGWLRSASKCRL